jgi:hypothetical protein
VLSSSILLVGALRGREEVSRSFQAVEARYAVRLSDKYHHSENQIDRNLLRCSGKNQRKIVCQGPGLDHYQDLCGVVTVNGRQELGHDR